LSALDCDETAPTKLEQRGADGLARRPDQAGVLGVRDLDPERPALQHVVAALSGDIEQVGGEVLPHASERQARDLRSEGARAKGEDLGDAPAQLGRHRHRRRKGRGRRRGCEHLGVRAGHRDDLHDQDRSAARR
jgi:hypothetical protein